jgi:hypothetical protein
MAQVDGSGTTSKFSWLPVMTNEAVFPANV